MVNVRMREKNGAVILDLEGNIDINASNLVETVGWVLKYKSRNLIFNFSKVNLVNYIGISIIAVAYKNILNHKGKLRICTVPEHLKNLFTIVGLKRVFTFFNNEDEALRTIKGEEKISSILKTKLRRRFARIPYFAKIEYKPKRSLYPTLYQGKVINLSAIGLFIISKKIFPVDEILSTQIYFTADPGIIETDTKVVWVADRQIQPSAYPGMGLEFYDISQEIQESIVTFVQKNLAHSSE